MPVENHSIEAAYATKPNIVIPFEVSAARAADMAVLAATDIAALWDEGAAPAPSADFACTAIAITTGILTHASMSLAAYPDGTPVQFFGNKTGATEIEAGPKVYYVKRQSATTSTLSLTPGGPDIAPAAAGSAMVGCGLRIGAALGTQTTVRAKA